MHGPRRCQKDRGLAAETTEETAFLLGGGVLLFGMVLIAPLLRGTCSLTESMCLPQPFQVVFPHTSQVVGRHMIVSFVDRASNPSTDPLHGVMRFF